MGTCGYPGDGKWEPVSIPGMGNGNLWVSRGWEMGTCGYPGDGKCKPVGIPGMGNG